MSNVHVSHTLIKIPLYAVFTQWWSEGLSHVAFALWWRRDPSHAAFTQWWRGIPHIQHSLNGGGGYPHMQHSLNDGGRAHHISHSLNGGGGPLTYSIHSMVGGPSLAAFTKWWRGPITYSIHWEGAPLMCSIYSTVEGGSLTCSIHSMVEGTPHINPDSYTCHKQSPYMQVMSMWATC